MSSRILIVDFGSQFTQLIARRVREARVYSESHPPSRTVEWIREWKPTGIILSGGPNSVYGDNVPLADPATDFQHPLSTDLEAVWRFVNLGSHSARRVGTQSLAVPIVPAEDAEERHAPLMKAGEREWGAIVTRVHHHRDTLGGKPLQKVGDRGNTVVRVGHDPDPH